MKPESNPERRPAPPSAEPEPNLSPSPAVLADERELAASDDAALVRYLARWEKALCRLQRAHPARWRVAGLSEEEVRDALTLRLLEALRRPEERALPPPAGRQWALCIMVRHLSVLRQAFRLGAMLTDLEQAPLLEWAPTEEERWLSLEADACRAVAGARARRQLSQPQRRWFAAMQLAAAGGSFFEASDRLNLSAAARVLGKDRSSAQRAYESLQACFQRELEGIE